MIKAKWPMASGLKELSEETFPLVRSYNHPLSCHMCSLSPSSHYFGHDRHHRNHRHSQLAPTSSSYETVRVRVIRKKWAKKSGPRRVRLCYFTSSIFSSSLLFHIINILITFVISHHQYSHHLSFFIDNLTSHLQRIMMAMLEMNIQPNKARSHEGERTHSTYLPSA